MLVGDVLKLLSILIIIDYRFVALPEIRNKQKQNPSMVVLTGWYTVTNASQQILVQ